MHIDEEALNILSRRVVASVLTVGKTLGSGFAEKVYKNALAHEVRETGLTAAQQRGIAGVICWSRLFCWLSSRRLRRWTTCIAANV
jgi:hypothetical protein